MTKSIESYKSLLNHMSEMLIEENMALRDSIQRIDSLLKHTISLLDESLFSEGFGKVDANNKFNTEQSYHKALSNTTRVLQVEDIVSQIIYLEVNRTIEIDETLRNIKKLTLNEEFVNQELLETIDRIKLLKTTRKHPTDQVSLDAGDIELF